MLIIGDEFYAIDPVIRVVSGITIIVNWITLIDVYVNITSWD